MSLALNSIHQADCVKALKKVEPGSVDLAFADPPFNIGYEYDEYDDRKERDAYLAWSKQWISGVHQALKPAGTFWLAIGDEYAAELKILSQEIGFNCRSWVVWYYTFGVNCKKKFTRSHAHLFHFVKDATNYTFNWSDPANRVPSARQLVYADTRANQAGRLPDDTWVLRPQDLVDGFTPEEDTWYFPRVNGTFKERAGFHGCQMPEQLLGRIIRCCSNPGDLVLDPFSGSSTTVVVAKKLGRQWLGFELSKDYVKRGRARLDAAEAGDPLNGAPEPNMSAPTTANGKTLEKKGNSVNGKPTRRIGKTSVASETAPKMSNSPEIDGTNDPKLATQVAAKTNGNSHALSLADFERGLIEAFKKSSRGFSVDRVIADPELDEAFLAKCKRLGLPENPVYLNRSLFGLRKAGKLVQFATTRRTEFDWRHVDQFIFASEIAWRQIYDQQRRSLDEIFCDPSHATEFDRLAMNYAPGFTPLEYRWAALKLRKASNRLVARSQAFGDERRTGEREISEMNFDEFAGLRGIYLISSRGQLPFYAGEALDLGERMHCKFGNPGLLQNWQKLASSLTIEIHRCESASPTDLLARQCRLIRQFEPALNYPFEVAA